MAGGNRYKHRSLGGGLVPNNQQAPQNNFYVAPTKRDYLAEALALAQAGLQGTAQAGLTGIGEALSNPTKSLAALLTPGSGALAVNDALAKPAADQLVRDWGGVKPAIQAGKDAMALADILSGKEKSVPFAPAYAGQKASDALVNAGTAALDASAFIPAGVVPKMGKSAGKAVANDVSLLDALKGRSRQPQVNARPAQTGPTPYEYRAENDLFADDLSDVPENAIFDLGADARLRYRTPETPEERARFDWGLPSYLTRKNVGPGEQRELLKGFTAEELQSFLEGKKTSQFSTREAQNRFQDIMQELATRPTSTWGKSDYDAAMERIKRLELESDIEEGFAAPTAKNRSGFSVIDNPQANLPLDMPNPSSGPTTLGMGFPFGGKDGEKPLLSALRDVFKGKPKESPLDQFAPPKSLDDIFTGGAPRGPRELTGGSQNPAGMDGSAFNLNTPEVPYDPAKGFQGIDSRLGKPKPPNDLVSLLAAYGAASGMGASLWAEQAQKR